MLETGKYIFATWTGISLLLLGQTDVTNIYDLILNGGGMTILAGVILVILLKVLPMYSQAIRDAAAEIKSNISELIAKIDSWENRIDERTRAMQEIMQEVMQKFVEQLLIAMRENKSKKDD